MRTNRRCNYYCCIRIKIHNFLNGNISVFPYPAERPASAKEAGITVKKQPLPVTIIDDGRLLSANLPIAGKDQQWLKRTLDKHHGKLSDTFLLTVDDGDRVICVKKEDAQ